MEAKMMPKRFTTEKWQLICLKDFAKMFLFRRNAVVKDAAFKMLRRIRECVLSGL